MQAMSAADMERLAAAGTIPDLKLGEDTVAMLLRWMQVESGVLEHPYVTPCCGRNLGSRARVGRKRAWCVCTRSYRLA